MVESPLSMREVPGSVPEFYTSILFYYYYFLLYLKTRKYCLFRSAFAVYYFVFSIISCTYGPYSLSFVGGRLKPRHSDINYSLATTEKKCLKVANGKTIL